MMCVVEVALVDIVMRGAGYILVLYFRAPNLWRCFDEET